MKKKLVILLSIMLVIILGSSLVVAFAKKETRQKDKLTIVTSFYPMYLLTQNIADGLNVEVINLTDYKVGCLHDYQLTTLDMQKLNSADVFIMNGGGMENFAEDVLKAYPDLPIINASEGIEFLQSNEHNHDSNNNNSPQVQPENNAHVWMNMNNYLKQIQTVQDGLAKIDKENAATYQANGNQYQTKVKTLKDKMETTMKGAKGTGVVIFHDSFAYLAQELGLDVVYTVNLDGDYALSAGDVANAINEVNQHKIKVLFTEEQYSSTIADSIAKETGAKVYVIDSLVTGGLDKNTYLNSMENNIAVLQQALGK